MFIKHDNGEEQLKKHRISKQSQLFSILRGQDLRINVKPVSNYKKTQVYEHI